MYIATVVGDHFSGGLLYVRSGQALFRQIVMYRPSKWTNIISHN